MHTFCIDLPDGTKVSGRSTCQNSNHSSQTSDNNAAIPLIVCIHGGTFDSSYFDSTPELSIERVTSLLNIPVVAVDRPGYGQTATLGKLEANETWLQESAKRLHNTILPVIWHKFADRANSIVLWGHSIGTATTIAIAGLHGQSQEAAGYPLSGLICSAIGSRYKTDMPELMEIMKHITPEGLWPADLRSKMMLKPQFGLCTPEALSAGLDVKPPAPPAEIDDIVQSFLSWRRQYSKEVRVPVLYGLPEYDCFWPEKSLDDPGNPESKLVNRLAEFAGTFERSPTVSSGIVLRAPHNIEMSKQARAWAMRCCGFALECAFAHDTEPAASN